ncbi:hypothetical protein B0O80DRAFT_440324, partial [Mortierella sp. GBAus27b]
MTTIATKKSPSGARMLSILAVLAILAARVNAEITCSSPSGGTYNAGDTISIGFGWSGVIPYPSNIDSGTATFTCNDGSSLGSTGISKSGGSWTIPGSTRCTGINISFSGKWSGLLFGGNFNGSCKSVTVVPAALPEPSPNPPTTPPPVTQPPTTQPPTEPPRTTPPAATTEAPKTTTQQPQQTSTSPSFTTTVISGTTTVIVATPTATTPLVGISQVTTPAGSDPSSTQIAGLPPSINQEQSQKSGNGGSNVPAAALGAVGGVAALALIVFGLVMTRKRNRMRQEQQDREGFNPEFEKHGYAYDPSTPTQGGNADDYSIPSLQTAAYVPKPEQSYQGDGGYGYGAGDNSKYGYAAAGAAVGAGVAAGAMYGSERRQSYSSETEALGHHVANSGMDPTLSSGGLLPFPVPASTNDALRQQYDLANRASVVSQESMTDSLPGAGGAMAAAAAVSQQLSLKQQFDHEAGLRGSYGDQYSEVDESELNYLPTGSPAQTFISARNSPMAASTLSPPSAFGTTYTTDGAPTRSSAYETVRSVSPASAVADSPTLSHASLRSQDISIPIPAIPTSDWRLPGSGRPESHHIRQLIQNVLDD